MKIIKNFTQKMIHLKLTAIELGADYTFASEKERIEDLKTLFKLTKYSDELYKTIMTNQNAFGVQKILDK